MIRVVLSNELLCTLLYSLGKIFKSAPKKMITIEKDYKDLHLCCALFACVGVGYLFPFSALTQPVDYWKKVFPDRNIEFPLVTLYMWINLICLFIVVFCVKRYLYARKLCYLSNSMSVFLPIF